MRGRCIVQNCTKGARNSGHTLPNDSNKLKQWLEICKNTSLNKIPLEVLRKGYVICTKHFSEDSFIECRSKARRLKVCAIPTLHLPSHGDQEIVEVAHVPEEETFELINESRIDNNNLCFATTLFEVSPIEKHIVSNPVPAYVSPPFFQSLDISSSERDLRKSISMGTPPSNLPSNLAANDGNEYFEATLTTNRKRSIRNEVCEEIRCKRRRIFLGKRKNIPLTPVAMNIHNITKNIRRKHARTALKLKRYQS